VLHFNIPLTGSVLHLELLLFNFIGSLRGVNDTKWLQCLHYCLELVDLAAVVKEYAGLCCWITYLCWRSRMPPTASIFHHL